MLLIIEMKIPLKNKNKIEMKIDWTVGWSLWPSLPRTHPTF